MKSGFLRSINWFGLIAGILMIVLPFMGPWWIGQAGTGATGAFRIATSPFDLSISLMGQPLTSALVGLFLLFTKIAFIIAGIFLILSSLLPTQWWSQRLFRYGVMKPFSQAVFFILPLVIAALVVNVLLPNILPGLLNGAGLQINTIISPIAFIVVVVLSIYVAYKLFCRLLSKISRETEKSQIKGNIILTSIFIATIVAGIFVFQSIPPPALNVGGAQVSLKVPYVVGTATSTVQIVNPAVTFTAPATLSLTATFLVAVATGVLGIIARIYQGRFASPAPSKKKK